MWMMCDDILAAAQDGEGDGDEENQGNNTAAKVDPYALAFCNAFRAFSASPRRHIDTLLSGTTRLLARGIFVDKSKKVRVMRPIDDKTMNLPGNFYTVNYQKLLKSANDKKGSYQRLCNVNAATPCTTSTQTGCNTVKKK